ncbi:MAG: DUF2997 domain-containing protein [Cyanobacteria bacterium]|jgi:hypothetical protein|nr:DUF2997 domain-containing protein [Cyanobacteria bacterium GSL.Bin21]
MAEYQRVEYRIGKDGKIKETVIEGSGESCLDTTSDIESALGEVESQELLPEYYQGQEMLIHEETQTLEQGNNG